MSPVRHCCSNGVAKEGFGAGVKKTVAAIGIFDGVHLGHRAIIKSAVRRARVIKGRSVIITFDPHPLKVLQPHKSVPLLMSTAHRARLIKELGVNLCLILKFNKQFSNLKPRDFVKKILVNKLKVSEVYIGSDFVFGKDCIGDASTLQKYGHCYGFEVKIVPMIKIARRIVSSTLIRNLIIKGRLEQAAQMLGRPVTVFGTVIRGARRGKLLGYPTANINPHHEAIPPNGVYAVWVRLKNRKYGGALYIGTRPTFREAEPAIEVHIFNFGKFIYGEEIEIIFVKRLRGDRKFKSQGKLVEQIKKDDIAARRILKLDIGGHFFRLVSELVPD